MGNTYSGSLIAGATENQGRPCSDNTHGKRPTVIALFAALLVLFYCFGEAHFSGAWQLQIENEAQPSPPPAGEPANAAPPEKESAGEQTLDLFNEKKPATPPRASVAPAPKPSPAEDAPKAPAPKQPEPKSKKEKIIWGNWNASPCRPAERAGFSMAFPQVVTGLHAACLWPDGKTSLPYTLKSGENVYHKGALKKGACSAGQEKWCLAQDENLNVVLNGGSFELIAQDLCDNAEAGQAGLLAVMGRASKQGEKAPPDGQGKLLLSRKLSPSDKPQSVSHENLIVTIPGGLLKQPSEISIREVPGAVRPLLSPDSLVLGAYDISLGGQHQIDQAITLELKFDPKTLDLKPGDESLVVGYNWNADRQQWLIVPAQVDIAGGRIVATTQNLSAKQWLVMGVEWVGGQGKAAQAGMGEKLWQVMRAAKPWARWAGDILWYNTFHRMERAGRDIIKRTPRSITKAHGEMFYVFYDRAFLESGPECNSKSWKPINDPSKYNKSIPTFVQDINYIMHDALNAYDKAGLGKPPTPVVVDMDSSVVRGKGPRGAYEYYYNRVHLKSDGGTPKPKPGAKKGGGKYSPEYVKHAAAHELFHGVQSISYIQKGLMYYLYHPYTIAEDPCLWWVEACAEYAANQVAFKLPKKLMGHGTVTPKLLTFPLEFNGIDPAYPNHGEVEYDRGFFIDYLVQQKGVTFKDLHFEMAKNLSGQHPVIKSLDAYLQKTTGKNLLQHYTKFAARFYLSEESPIAPTHRPYTNSRDFAADFPYRQYQMPIYNYQSGKRVVARPGLGKAPKINQAFDIKPGYASQLWAILPKPAPEGQRPFNRFLRVTSMAQDPDMWFGVYVLPENTWIKGEVKPAGEIKKVQQDVFVTINNGPSGLSDGLCILGANASLDRKRMAAIEVAETGVDLDVKSLTPLKGQYGAECVIEGKAYNLPQMKKAEYVVKDFTMQVKHRGACTPDPRGEFKFSFGGKTIGTQAQYYVFINDLSGEKPRVVSFGGCVVMFPPPKLKK